jgi:hypothetical protein
MTPGPIANHLYIGARSSFPFPSASPLRVRYSPTLIVENGVLIHGSLCCSLTLFLELEMFNLRVGSTVHNTQTLSSQFFITTLGQHSTTQQRPSHLAMPRFLYERSHAPYPVPTKSKPKSNIILKYNPRLTYKSVLPPISYV